MEGLKLGLTHYLISIWGTWILTVSIAIYYKWTEKKNFFFYMNYSYLVIAFAFFVHYNSQWLHNADLSSQPYGEDMLNLIATAKHLVPILFSTGYLQASVWWFERKWHRR
ncbi:MAG TPA: hypothetical protein VFM69_07085 [Pricia sp.]|nr:hypothetical protein [Pricia sp.]